MLYTRFLSIILSFTAIFNASSTETATSVLKHVVERINRNPIEVNFAVMAQGINSNGLLTIDNNMFSIVTDDLSTWYDGKTQWTLATSTGEVNITTPTHEELAEVNPLIILSSMASQYNVELGSAPTGSYILSLVARDRNNPISSADIKVNASTWSPLEITIFTNTGERYSIQVKNIKNLKKLPVSVFRFNQADYPGVEIVDLR